MEYIFDENKAGYFMGIAGDDNRYLQIFLNFLSNALKFTPNGGNIKVIVKLKETQIKSQEGGGIVPDKKGDSIS